MKEAAPINLEIDGVLDLHTFQPGEVKNLVPDYLQECLKKEILNVKIIHGKGTGTLRRIVHNALSKIPYVDSFHLAGEQHGSWGATFVLLRKTKGNIK